MGTADSDDRVLLRNDWCVAHNHVACVGSYSSEVIGLILEATVI